jgi:hypothetical protein
MFSPAWTWAGRAVSSFYALVNSDGYQLLAEQLGWDQARWQRWLVRVLGDELLGAAADKEKAPPQI